MSLPGEFKQTDTNEWTNQLTGDQVTIKKYRDVAGDPSTRRWHVHVNGESDLDAKVMIPNISVRAKKDRAVKAAKKVMKKLTVEELEQKLERKQELESALEEALATHRDRSQRSKKLDANMFNKKHYDLGDPDDIEKWASDPGSGDLDMVDTPVADPSRTEKMLEDQLEAVRQSIRDTQNTLNQRS